MGKNLRLLAISALITFIIGEVVLRTVFHFKPGMHSRNRWFNAVDTLIPLKGFIADSIGIFKIDPDAAAYLEQRCNAPTQQPAPPLENISWEVYGIDRDYRELNDPAFKNDFANYLRALRAKDTATLDDFEQAVIAYAKCPINKDGFRSIAFKKYNSKRKKILLLGDSFTWGHSTKNKTSSFADILLAKGYIVYNTGISGTDVPQYLAVAQHYIDSLQPDYVVVNFFMGNDIFYMHRQLKPYTPVFYCTNATNLLSCPNGIYFNTPAEAYDFAYAQLYVPKQGAVNKICRLTAATSIAWNIWKGLQAYAAADSNHIIHLDLPEYREYWKKADSLKQKLPACNSELQQLKELCTNSKAQFFLLAIPTIKGKHLEVPADVPHLFDSLPYYLPEGITIKDYEIDNGHYNEEAQKKHAAFIQKLVEGN